MEMPISEIMDRYTVAQVKMSKSSFKDEYKMQLNDYKSAVDGLISTLPNEKSLEVENIIQSLFATNLDMWDLEDALRIELENHYKTTDNNEETLKKIADIALEIRKQNVARSKFKNRICEIFDQVSFRDRKFQYYSGE